MKKTHIKIISALGLALSLQGCFFVAGAAAGAAAIAVVYDHRTINNILRDTDIANRISAELKKSPRLYENSHIEVTVFNRIVLLTGETPNTGYRLHASNIAKSVPEVRRVYNQLTIQGPSSSLIRTSDSWITTKIKAEMLATENLKSSTIKVVTDNGIVYLMGLVNHEQADIAVDIARQVSGVQKVVKIFQYKD